MFNLLAAVRAFTNGPEGATGNPATDLMALWSSGYEAEGEREATKLGLLQAVLTLGPVERRCGCLNRSLEPGAEALAAFEDGGGAAITYMELVGRACISSEDLFADPDAVEDLQEMADLCQEGDDTTTLNARFAFLLEEPGSRADELIDRIENAGGVVVEKRRQAFATNRLGLAAAILGSALIASVAFLAPAPDPLWQQILRIAGIFSVVSVVLAARSGRLAASSRTIRRGLVAIFATVSIALTPELATGVQDATAGLGVAALVMGTVLYLGGGLLLRFRAPLAAHTAGSESRPGSSAEPPGGVPEGRGLAPTVPTPKAGGELGGQVDGR